MTHSDIRKAKRAVVVAVGDLMMGDSPIAVGYGWRSRYPGRSAAEAIEGLRPALAGADIVFGNLEVQLARRGLGSTRMARDMMRGDPEYATLLRAVGFNVLSVANNHAMQHGKAAFSESVATMRKAGLDVAGIRGTDGWNAEPVIRTTSTGLTLGILAYSLRPRQYGRGEPSYASGPASAVLADVERLDAQVDRVIVSLHWGEEFASLPSEAEVHFAEQLSEAGVALVIGHHPHVVRPVVRRSKTIIAYSLGNTISDMIWRREFRRGLVLRCDLGRHTPEAETLALWTDAQYRAFPQGHWSVVIGDQPVPGLTEAAYRKAIGASMRAYRRAALGHMLRHFWRSPPEVALALLSQKLRNTWNRALNRGSDE